MVHRVFISLPMRGISEDEIVSKINSLRDNFINNCTHGEDEKFIFVDNFVNDSVVFPESVKHRRLCYLASAIQRIASCDMILMAKDWKSAPGCCVEYDVAMNYEIPLFIEINKDTYKRII